MSELREKLAEAEKQRDFEQSSRLTSEAQLGTIISNLQARLAGVEKERDAFSEAFAREQQTVRDIVAAAGPRDEEHDIFDHLKAMRGLIEQAVRALTELCDAAAMYDGSEIRIRCDSHGDAIGRMTRARSTLSLLKASRRPQNREETDAEKERIS